MNNNRELFKDNTKCVFIDDSIEKPNRKINEIRISMSTLVFVRGFGG